MLTTLLIWIVGVVILGSLFWCSARVCVALLLAIWTVAVGILVDSNLDDRFLWIPVVLAVCGVFGSMVVLADAAKIVLAANVVILALFAVSVEALKTKSLFERHVR